MMNEWQIRLTWRTEAKKAEFLDMNRMEPVKHTPTGNAYAWQSTVNGYVCTLVCAVNDQLAGNLVMEKVI